MNLPKAYVATARESFLRPMSIGRACGLRQKGPEKPFLQALIQLAAALHHFQRGNSRGAASLMQTALHRLEPHPDSFEGIAVASLCQEIAEWQKKVNTGHAPPDLAPPQIPVCG